MQRDTRITTLTKENEQLVGIREQLSTCNVNWSIHSNLLLDREGRIATVH